MKRDWVHIAATIIVYTLIAVGLVMMVTISILLIALAV